MSTWRLIPGTYKDHGNGSNQIAEIESTTSSKQGKAIFKWSGGGSTMTLVWASVKLTEEEKEELGQALAMDMFW